MRKRTVPHRKQIDTSTFRHLYPFKSHYLDINGLNYHFLDEGHGDPVVMLHGNPTWSFYYRKLVEGLSGGFRTVAPDHMGCGLSEKPDLLQYDYRLKSRVGDLENLLDHLGINKNITLVLHDWGGMIGMAYAVRHPERIRRFVIMNTAAFLPPMRKKLPVRLRVIRDTGPFATLAVLGFNLFARAALFMAPCKKLPEDVKSGLIAPYNSWENRISTLKFVQDIPLTKNDPSFRLVRYVDDNLHKLGHIPMLICWGEQDFVFDSDYRLEWLRRFPDATVKTFSDAGHYVLEDKPDEVLRLVKDFLTY